MQKFNVRTQGQTWLDAFFLQNHKTSKNFNWWFFYIYFFFKECKNTNQVLMSENFFSKNSIKEIELFKDLHKCWINIKMIFFDLTDLVFLPLTFFQQNCLRPYILESVFVWHCFVGRNICTNFTLDWNLVFDLWPLKIKSLTST